MEERTTRWLSRAVLTMLVLTLLGGMLVPVYADEIGWRFQERAGFDGVDKMFSEACGMNTLAVPPWFMMPVRWYSAFFNSAFADPFWIRVSGVLYALIWVALMLVLVRRVTPQRDGRAAILTISAGLLALGTMPLVMVWSRPEQPIILAVVAALIVALVDDPTGPAPLSTRKQAWIRSLAILVFSSIAVSYHVKGVFVVPLMLGCLFFASRGSAAIGPRIAAGLAMVVTTGWAASYWRSRLDCPEDSILRYAYDRHNISGSISSITSLDSAREFAGKMLHNVATLEYFANATPRSEPMSAWLEVGKITEGVSFYWFLALCCAWALALVLAGSGAVAAMVGSLRDRQLAPRPTLALVVFSVVLAWSSMQLIRNVYEAEFVLPLLVIAIILGLSCRDWTVSRAEVTVATGIGLLALVSPVAIAAIYGPSLLRAAAQPGYLPAQEHSVGVFGYEKLRPDIEAAARLCGISSSAKARALLIDDVTYFAFMRSSLPQHELGVLRGWNGRIADPIDYLRRRGSDGAILGCHLLPPALRAKARSRGEFCCLSAPR